MYFLQETVRPLVGGYGAAGSTRYIRLRQRCDHTFAQLKNERNSFESHWRELADYIKPRRPKWMTNDENRGDRRSVYIINSAATFALRTLSSGMMSGLTSPARPWFSLTAPDFDQAENFEVDAWLYFVTERMRRVFTKSNLYNTLPVLYSDLGYCGTGAMSVVEDFDAVIHCKAYPIGSYYIGSGPRGRVNMFAREYPMLARNIVDEFGRRPDGSIDWSNISDQVRRSMDSGSTEQWFDVRHIIMPNQDYDPTSRNPAKRQFSSIYYEVGSEEGKILRNRGFDYFPVLCPRWELSGEDIYGTDCPGMVALGDIKQLQLMAKRKLQAIDKKVNPPMVAPLSLRTRGASILPGDVNYVGDPGDRAGMRPAHEVNFNLAELINEEQQSEYRIRRAFYEDLFLMLATKQGDQPLTATEVNERHEEKLLALGPVLEQLNQDLLDPLIDVTFQVMLRQGLIPEPPQELQGVELKVEYTSIMSQAQRMVGLGTIERFATFATQAATIDPQILDKVDTDQIIDVYANLLSVQPGVLRTDEEAAQIRQARAQQQQQMMQMEMMKQGAGAVKDLANAPTGNDSALSSIANALGGGRG